MPKNVGFARRLGEKLREMGYWPEGRLMANYTKFGVEKGFVPSAVYRWLHGEMPRADTFYQLCVVTHEQAHWYLLGRRVPEPTPGSSLVDYMGVLEKHTREEIKRQRRTTRPRKTVPIRVGGPAEKPLPVAGPSRFKKNTTKGGINSGKDATLCELRGWTMAYRLLPSPASVVSGSYRVAA